MSVPKNERKPSDFKANSELLKLRKEITNLVMRNFGYSEVRYKKRIDDLEQQMCQGKVNPEKVSELKCRMNYFKDSFLKEEGKYVLEVLRKIVSEFTIANSIFISETDAKISEFIARRIHIELAISYCYVLNHELEYIMSTLPVDINKYKRFEDMLNKQIGLFKGVRKADNKFIKKESKKIKDLEDRLDNIEMLLDNNCIDIDEHIIHAISAINDQVYH